jgi:hypothetical protein
MHLGKNVRVVSLQFSFSNARFIPEGIRRVSSETDEERISRKTVTEAQGVLCIPPSEKCSVAGIEDTLNRYKYFLCDAFTKSRQANNGAYYQMVRFIFVYDKYVESFPSIQERLDMEAGLKKLSEEAMWRLRAFDNPYFRDPSFGTDRAYSINLEVREPLFEGGQPRTIWPKDQNGQRTGEPKVALKPDHQLVIADGSIVLMPTDK